MTATARRLLVATTLGCTLLVAPRVGGADDAQGPPTAERVQLDEQGGRFEEALAGWIQRYLGVKTAPERAQALQRYVVLAAKHGASPDPWLDDLVQRWGKGNAVIAGRRVVVLAPDSSFGVADAKLLGALFDAAELTCERITGVHPPQNLPDPNNKDDKRPRDAAGRFFVGGWTLPKPLSEQAFDGRVAPASESERGAAFAFQIAESCASSSIAAAPNVRARRLQPTLSWVVRDLAVREIGDATLVAAADKVREETKKRLDEDWSCGCLPAEAMGFDSAFCRLFFDGLEAERAAQRDPAESIRACLAERRGEVAWGRGRVATARDEALEPLTKSFSSGFCDVFRRAGVLPVGAAFEEMKTRLAADDLVAEAVRMQGERQTAAAMRAFSDAANLLGASPTADEMLCCAQSCDDDAKRARAGVKKIGGLEGFEFIGPLPDRWDRDQPSVAMRLMPLAVATADGRHLFKMKPPPDPNAKPGRGDPADVLLKWADVKEEHAAYDMFDRIVPHTPIEDRRGLSWGSASVAATKWGKDLGRFVRLRPMRRDGDVSLLVDGRPCDRFPDGSFVVPGTKGAEIVLCGSGRVLCDVPWRDAKSVDADLAAAAAEQDPILALRPWAARRVAPALPVIVDVLLREPDASFVRDVKLLIPYRGGDAAACDAILDHAKGRPAVLAAYLDACRGCRDVAMLDKIVALGAAADATPEVLSRVQLVLEAALFRKVAEKGADLAALWERGRKWTQSVATAEFEETRDLYETTWSSLKIVADPDAWGRACAASYGQHGEGYLALDVPDCPSGAFLAVRWKPTYGDGRLVFKGFATDGKKPPRAFNFDVSPPADAKGYAIDLLDFGPVAKGRLVLAIDDPCASGCRVDAVALGAKPIE